MASGRCNAMRTMSRIPQPYTPTLWNLSHPRVLSPCPLSPIATGFLRANEGAPIPRSANIASNRMLIGKYWWDFSSSIRQSLFLSNVDGEDAFSIAIRSGIPMNYIYIHIYFLDVLGYIYIDRDFFDATLISLILINENRAQMVMKHKTVSIIPMKGMIQLLYKKLVTLLWKIVLNNFDFCH